MRRPRDRARTPKTGNVAGNLESASLPASRAAIPGSKLGELPFSARAVRAFSEHGLYLIRENGSFDQRSG